MISSSAVLPMNLFLYQKSGECFLIKYNTLEIVR